MQSMFNSNSRNLTPDQQRLLTIYINQYNQTNTHIDLLLDMLDEIRGNIVNVINLGQTRRTRINRHTRGANTNINRLVNQILNDRQDRYVHYNLENPINPFIYQESPTNTYPRRNDNFRYFMNRYYNETNTSNNNTINDDIASFLNNFLNSNVTVRPTTQQIENASRIVRYSDIDNPLSDTCPISLDNFNQDDMVRQILPCGHIFHQEQFNEWFDSHVRCPVCRYDIRDYRALSRRNTPNTDTQSPPVLESPSVSQSPPVSDSSRRSSRTPNSQPTISQTNPSAETTSGNSRQSLDDIFTNFNVIRNPDTNSIDQVTFDMVEPDITNNVLNMITRNIFNSILNPQSRDENERFMIDPSNNLLFYETIIRPPNSNSGSGFGNGNSSNNNS